MFEETKPTGSFEPKDIFQEVEPVAQSKPAAEPLSQPLVSPTVPVGGVSSGMMGGPKEPLANLSEIVHPRRFRFWRWLIILVIVLLLIAGAWYVYARFFQVATTPENLPITTQVEQPTIIEEPLVTSTEPALESSTAQTELISSTSEANLATLDSDGDGLPDNQEQTLGTNLNNPDTDADGLSDRDEVVVYRTNPLVADTDGDGYKDGEEVKNNYNPLGPGRLRALPQNLGTSSTSTQP
ncbi:MAG: hypothetical protein NTV81_01595 [Candidatus Komeilibacteria bacterium]|nr:hypothetical protein [Candidatus Komeilibacteria bacterium]